MDNDVVAPNSWGKILNEMRDVEKQPDLYITDQELSHLAEQEGWKRLKEYLEARIEYVRDLFRGKIGTDTYELIGQKAIISDIIQDELRGLIQKVENTHKEVKTQEVKNRKPVTK